jgi:hypothetical protein
MPYSNEWASGDAAGCAAALKMCADDHHSADLPEILRLRSTPLRFVELRSE